MHCSFIISHIYIYIWNTYSNIVVNTWNHIHTIYKLQYLYVLHLFYLYDMYIYIYIYHIYHIYIYHIYMYCWPTSPWLHTWCRTRFQRIPLLQRQQDPARPGDAEALPWNPGIIGWCGWNNNWLLVSKKKHPEMAQSK